MSDTRLSRLPRPNYRFGALPVSRDEAKVSQTHVTALSQKPGWFGKLRLQESCSVLGGQIGWIEWYDARPHPESERRSPTRREPAFDHQRAGSGDRRSNRGSGEGERVENLGSCRNNVCRSEDVTRSREKAGSTCALPALGMSERSMITRRCGSTAAVRSRWRCKDSPHP
jgi:hypothetical protein